MIALELNSLLSDGWDWHDAVTKLSSEKGVAFDSVVRLYKGEFGIHPSEFDPSGE